MKQMKRINVFAFLIFVVAFDQFFWDQNLALNFALFSLLSIIHHFIDSPVSFSKPSVQMATVGNVIATFMLVYHNSIVSSFVAIISWIVLIGFFHEEDLRTVYRAVWSSILHFFKIPPFLKNREDKLSKEKSTEWMRWMKIVVLPTFIVIVFFLIFRGANLVFKDVTDQIGHDIKWAFERIFDIASWERLLFVFLGALIANWVVFQSQWKIFSKMEYKKTDELLRVRDKNQYGFISIYFKEIFPMKFKMLRLKDENKSGVLAMGMICMLLLIINSIDIFYVWFGLNYNPKMNFAKDVHQGVYMLIFSIVLSILVMLYYFRRNLNFYSKNKLLKNLAYTWIALNVVLIISVIIRNVHYINHLGLTHKRIGIFIFLAIVVLGLASLYWKISQRKSFFYMSKFNSWSIYFMLIFMTCFNWDMIIFNYNFAQKDKLKFDRFYVLDYLSDEAIINLKLKEKELNKNNDLNIIQDYQEYRYNTLESQFERITLKLANDKNTWQSWNYRKYKVKKLIHQVKS
jgi:hypothetical protein